MVTTIGTTFPLNWQYGSEEKSIFDSTVQQVQRQFTTQRNLVINTTWFGPQFNNGEWQKVLSLDGKFDNLFLIAAIDPMYLQEQDLQYIMKRFSIKKLYKIGMFDGSPFEWNFHAAVVNDKCPAYQDNELLMTSCDYVYMLYQRKPRLHRVQLTNLLTEQRLENKGIITLGDNTGSTYDWSQGQRGPVLVIEDSPKDYLHNGNEDDYAGIPNDLVSLGRLDLWQRHFLNIVSETEFDEWQPRFVTEKTWKPIIGLRPFIIHGQRSIYGWLRSQGFKTFNGYWSHVPIETSDDQHGNVIEVIRFLCEKSPEELHSMYDHMLPDLMYNKMRYKEFAHEQKHKMHNLFSSDHD